MDVKPRGIGLENESSLHAALKKAYAGDNGNMEVSVEGYVVDVEKDGHLIEIQTKNISSMSKKLGNLCKNNKLKLVHPIAEEKWITLVSEEGEIIRRRKSTKKGKLTDVFDELVRAHNIFLNENLSLEVVMVKVEEIRRDDGKGSWRRKGISIYDKRLLELGHKKEFKCKEELLEILPKDIDEGFTNKDLAKSLKINVAKARKITYCLKKLGIIKEVGKKGRELSFNVDRQSESGSK